MGRLKENYFKKTKTKKGFCTNSARFKALSSDKNVSFLLAQGGPISYESFNDAFRGKEWKLECLFLHWFSKGL